MPAGYEIHIQQNGGGSGPPPSIDDHFAPKYIVGNVPAGDPAVMQGPPFVYVPDVGDGAGIALALSQPFGPGDVWIRPGVYNYNLGAVVAPLVIPSGVRVYGSGNTTSIIGRSTLNQGVFTMGSLSQLRDMRLLVLASDAGSLGSDAVVRVIGEGAIFQNLQIAFVTAAGGQLREGIRFDAAFTALASDLLNVGVSAATLTGSASPTRCIALFNSAFVFARHVQTLGGDEAIYSEQGIFICKDLLALDWSLFGVRHVGKGGAIRIDEALMQAAAASVGGFCVSLAGGRGHVLRSVSCQNSGSAGAVGIAVVPPPTGTIDRVQIDDCETFSTEIGIVLGGPKSSVTDASVVNCTVDLTSYGIVVQNALSALCHIKGNKVSTSVPGGSFGIAIWAQGLRHEIEGNHVLHSNPNLNSQAVLLECTRTTCRGNTIEFADLIGLVGTGPRLTIGDNEMTSSVAGVTTSVLLKSGAKHSTVGDNTLQCLFKSGGAPAITVDASFCTIGDNSIEVTLAAPVAAGIVFNVGADNNTCIGNVVEGSPDVAVSDAGARNEVAHNIGV
jgi:hypothetical protein